MFAGGLLGAAVVELFIIPALAGWCQGSGCTANAYGVEVLHLIAIAFALGGIAVNLPAITGYITKR